MRNHSNEDWRRLFALLDTALELPPLARESWLAELAADPAQLSGTLRELLSLKERHESGDFLQQLPQFTVSPDDPALAVPLDTSEAGSVVGPYRLLTRLGRGGMSTVWVAERIDGLLKRRVAVKLPHVGWAQPELADRMARERDILASLEHPDIARLYDAGVANDGRPFLALELVDGQAIDAYCDASKADVNRRVRIALQTARAVAYAHSRMVVHRDLKPSNILVDSGGQVHLLDFGISKLLEPDAAATMATQFGSRAHTPDYASPEQLRGETVTATTDVYSLGVVLYQLLSGSLPYPSRAAHPAAEESVPRADPPLPSAVARDRAFVTSLRGDLDTIVLKALKGSISERYSTMDALADDLDRYLRGAPVRARRDTSWYRLRKFAARNRRVLSAMTAAVVATVAISVGFAVHRARQQSAETARALEAFADNLAQSSVPSSPPTRDVVAYREYLQARGIMIRPTPENLREVVRLTEDVTARDPNFAQAYAVLAGANIMFLDNGYARPDALARAESAVHKALALNPRHPGALATLGAIAAHRGEWLAAEMHFAKAFEFDDGTGRIHARYAEAVLNSTGRLRAALQIFQAQLRLTPTHSRAAMQVAVGLGMQPGHDREAMHHVDIAMTHGWPGDSKDVEKLNSEIARRAGRFAEAAEYQALTLPDAVREAGGLELVQLLHQALAQPTRRSEAIAALDAMNARGPAAAKDSFAMLMFSMNWYALLGDLDRAYLVSGRWLQESARQGLAGIPFNFGYWLPEMRAFRADPRFAELTRQMGLMPYWQKYGPPDGCLIRGTALECRGPGS